MSLIQITEGIKSEFSHVIYNKNILYTLLKQFRHWIHLDCQDLKTKLGTKYFAESRPLFSTVIPKYDYSTDTLNMN